MKKSLVIKRSIVIGGHKTSVSLEDDFWRALKEIALSHRVTLSSLVGSIDSQRQGGNLSSAVRLFVLEHYRQSAAFLDWQLSAKWREDPRSSAIQSGLHVRSLEDSPV